VCLWSREEEAPWAAPWPERGQSRATLEQVPLTDNCSSSSPLQRCSSSSLLFLEFRSVTVKGWWMRVPGTLLRTVVVSNVSAPNLVFEP
jgi:hypothetical protein